MSTPDAPKTSAPNWKSGRADGLSAARDAVAVVAHALHFPTLLSALLAEIVMAACARAAGSLCVDSFGSCSRA